MNKMTENKMSKQISQESLFGNGMSLVQKFGLIRKIGNLYKRNSEIDIYYN